MHRWISVWSAALLAILAATAHADTVYTHHGNDFNSATAPYTTTDSVDTALGVFTDDAGNLTGWDFIFSVDPSEKLPGRTPYRDSSSIPTDVSYNGTSPACLALLGMGMIGACLMLPSLRVLPRATRTESGRLSR